MRILVQGGIFGPFFFENEQREAFTVNGDRYRAMLNEFLFTKIEEEDIDNIWFQQDEATCHTAEATLYVLRHVFENRLAISELRWRVPSKISAIPISQRQLTL